MNANAVRMIASAAGGLMAIYWLDLGVAGFFAAVAAGFCLYAAMLVHAVFGVKNIKCRDRNDLLNREARSHSTALRVQGPGHRPAAAAADDAQFHARVGAFPKGKFRAPGGWGNLREVVVRRLSRRARALRLSLMN